MCQKDAHMELISQQPPFNPEENPSNGDEGSDVRQASQGEKATVAPSSNESGKKKRVHRAAKLKQCKMYARREQWLAQVSSKINKPESCASSHASSQDDREAKELHSSPGGLDMGTVDSKDRKEEQKSKQYVASSSHTDAIGEICSKKQVLESNASEAHKGALPTEANRKDPSSSRPQSAPNSNCEPLKSGAPLETGDAAGLDIEGFTTTWSSSDTSTSRSSSSRASSSSGGSGSDDDNEVEDWEVAADALHVQASVQEAKPIKSESQYSEQNRPLDMKSTALSSPDLDKCVLKPESKYRPGNFGSRMRVDAGRAWRPDDVSRPQTLPCLSKQHSFPLQSGTSVWGTSRGSVWGLPPPPSHCPICTEELDTTDSSFVPCSCGFRLCLFCHHRIVVGDGRCPGCRKSYNLEAALKLSRTSSVRPRI